MGRQKLFAENRNFSYENFGDSARNLFTKVFHLICSNRCHSTVASHTTYLVLYYALICLSLIFSPFFIIHHIFTSLMCFKGFQNYDSSLNLWVVLQSHSLLHHFHMLTWVYFVLTSPFPHSAPALSCLCFLFPVFPPTSISFYITCISLPLTVCVCLSCCH